MYDDDDAYCAICGEPISDEDNDEYDGICETCYIDLWEEG